MPVKAYPPTFDPLDRHPWCLTLSRLQVRGNDHRPLPGVGDKVSSSKKINFGLRKTLLYAEANSVLKN
jgi:hypothetical protein